MKTQITHLKLARYPEILSGPVRPIHWDVDPSSACDHRCGGCPYIFDGEIDPMLGVVREQSAKDKRTMLDYEAFVRFLDQAVEHGAKAITFVGGGEPTLHPRFMDMMACAFRLQLKFGLISHFGRPYDAGFFDRLTAATWVRVSLNAGTRATYLRHQGKDDFIRALHNIEHAAYAGMHIGVSFLVTGDNYGEIQLAAERVKDAGAAFIQYKPLVVESDQAAVYNRIEASISNRLRLTVERIADESFQVLDQWSDRLAELERHNAQEFSGPCHVPRSNPKLGANGVVYTCCELAYSDKAALGSIYDEPLSAILERAGMTCGVIDMAECPQCWSKPINTLINEGRLSEAQVPPESPDQEFV